MENMQPEKGTCEILQHSRLELNDPRFNDLLAKRIVGERNRKIKLRFYFSYSLIAVSLGLIIFLIASSLNFDSSAFTNTADNIYQQAVNTKDGNGLINEYGFFIFPLLVLLVFKKLVDSRLKY